MTTPLKPTNDPDPWEPSAPQSSDPDYGDEGTAAGTYQGVYGTGQGMTAPVSTPAGSKPRAAGNPVPDPTLAMAFSAAPDLDPVKATGSGSSSYVLPGLPFAIDLGELRTAEQSILTATSNAVTDYATLKNQVAAALASPDLFGQNVVTYSSASNPSSWGDHHPDPTAAETVESDTDYDAEATQYAAQFNAEMTLTLQGVASALEVIGQFTALLNNAGQAYAQADHNSAIEVPTVAVPTPASG